MRKSDSVSEEELNKPDSVNVLNNMYSRYCNESGSVHDNVLTGIKNFLQFTILYSQTLLLVAWDTFVICLPKKLEKYGGHNYKLHLAGYKS